MSKKAIEILPPPLPFPSLKMDDVPKAAIPKRHHRSNGLDEGNPDLGFDIPPPPKLRRKDTHDFEIHQSKEETDDSKREIKAAINRAKRKNIFSFFAKILEKKPKLEKVEIPRISPSPVLKTMAGAKIKLEECRRMLESFDLDGARQSYIELLGIYNSLPIDEKKLIYDDMNEIYSMRKSAESIR